MAWEAACSALRPLLLGTNAPAVVGSRLACAATACLQRSMTSEAHPTSTTTPGSRSSKAGGLHSQLEAIWASEAPLTGHHWDVATGQVPHSSGTLGYLQGRALAPHRSHPAAHCWSPQLSRTTSDDLLRHWPDTAPAAGAEPVTQMLMQVIVQPHAVLMPLLGDSALMTLRSGGLVAAQGNALLQVQPFSSSMVRAAIVDDTAGIKPDDTTPDKPLEADPQNPSNVDPAVYEKEHNGPDQVDLPPVPGVHKPEQGDPGRGTGPEIPQPTHPEMPANERPPEIGNKGPSIDSVPTDM